MKRIPLAKNPAWIWKPIEALSAGVPGRRCRPTGRLPQQELLLPTG
jgi:methylphosphotriester-DNA--protein-cysteine methyltransferase